MTPRTTLLTLGEAAERLGVSPGTLRNQANHGRIKATKRGRDWMVTEAEVSRYGAEQRRPGKVAAAFDVPAEVVTSPETPTFEALHERLDTFGAPRPAPKPGKR